MTITETHPDGRKIKARRPCQDCGKQCTGRRCRDCYSAALPARDQPTPRPCAFCGASCRSQTGVCRDCRHSQRIDSEPIHEHGLTGGHWEPRGLIQVWVEANVCLCAATPRVRENGPSAKNEATRTADRSNGRHWSGSSRHHSAKNGRD